MRLFSRVKILTIFLALAVCDSCSKESEVTKSSPKGLLSGMKTFEIYPKGAVVKAGNSLSFSAVATYKNGDVLDLTDKVKWSVDQSAAAEAVNLSAKKEAVFTAKNADSTTEMFAVLDSMTASTKVKIVSMVGLTLEPSTATMAVDGQQKILATAAYSDGSTEDVSSKVAWQISPSTAGAFGADAPGLFKAAELGVGTIHATWVGFSASAKMTVNDSKPVSIALTPPTATTHVIMTSQYALTATYSDLTTKDVTATAQWVSSNPAIANFEQTTNPGLITAKAAGSATLTATLGELSASGDLTVLGPVLTSVSVTPVTPTVGASLHSQLTATGVYADGSSADLTTAVTWSSSATNIATISDASGSKGYVTGVAAGTTKITASTGGSGSVSGTRDLTVTTATISSIAITPSAAVSLAAGLTSQLTATATMSDATTQDITSSVNWSSATAAAATISSGGLVTAVAVGTSQITASLSGVSTTKNITVTAAALTSIAVTPASTASLPLGLTQQLTATGTYTNGTTADITATVAWTSSQTAKVIIGTMAPNIGLATALDLGSSTVTATLSGRTGTAAVTGTAATLISIAVSPTSASKAKGLTQQFTAMGTYSDDSTVDITSSVTWTASGGFATVSNSGGSIGVATGVNIGSSTITATISGVSGTGTLVVGAKTLQSIAVTPSNPSVTNGATQQFTATGTYSDSTTADLSSAATWASASTGVATINSSGLATSASVGTSSITAALSAVTSPGQTLTVSGVIGSAPVISTQPVDVSVLAGSTATFTVVATGDPAPTIQWQVSADGGSSWSDIPNATAATYSPSTVVSNGGSQYRATLTNAIGVANTSAATLTVNPRSFSTLTTYTTTVFKGLSTGSINLVDLVDPQAITLPTTYTATINWGDDNVEPNVAVSHTDADGTTIHVRGTHTYSTSGSYQPIITLPNSAGSAFTTVLGNTATLTVGTNVSSKVSITRGSPLKNATTGLWAQTVTMNNISGVDLTGNLDFVLTSLTVGVSLDNKTGATADGTDPYIRFSTTGMKAGKSSTKSLNFALPDTMTSFSYNYLTFTN